MANIIQPTAALVPMVVEQTARGERPTTFIPDVKGQGDIHDRPGGRPHGQSGCSADVVLRV